MKCSKIRVTTWHLRETMGETVIDRTIEENFPELLKNRIVIYDLYFNNFSYRIQTNILFTGKWPLVE